MVGKSVGWLVGVLWTAFAILAMFFPRLPVSQRGGVSSYLGDSHIEPTQFKKGLPYSQFHEETILKQDNTRNALNKKLVKFRSLYL